MLGAQRLDWEDIKSFVVVAEAGTVRRAARNLGVHHSTLSRRIESLEHALGAKLFDRRPEGYILNAAGEKFAETARECGLKLNDAERLVSGQDRELSGDVTVTIAPALAVHVFGPRLAEFADRHPNIEVRMLTTTDMLDISRREADVAVRIDNNPPETLVGKRLFPYYQTAYATPAYLANHDLEGETQNARLISWLQRGYKLPEWAKDLGFGGVPLWGYFPDPALQVAAARGGLGIALLPCIIGDADPLLVRATSRKPSKARDIWVLTHSDLRRTARIRAFMDFAEDVLRDTKDQLMGMA